MNCATNERAALVGEVAFGDDGSVSGAEWENVPVDDPVQQKGCEVT